MNEVWLCKAVAGVMLLYHTVYNGTVCSETIQQQNQLGI